MSTKTVSVTNLVGSQSIATIRSVDIQLILEGARPSTKMNVFFDRVNVNYLCQPLNGNLGDDLITDEYGFFTGLLKLPGGEFTTGSKEILVTDASTIAEATIPGSTYGISTATFSSNGVEQYFQTTTTTTKTFTIQNVYQTTTQGTITGSTLVSSDIIGDPLAQSFFTYGVKNGVFLSSIDLYFYKKDVSVPVRLDVRRLINGTPGRFDPNDKTSVVYVYPNSINTSSDASAATTFTFSRPIFLEPNEDYCFVVYSNSKNYEIFTAKMGEESFENGKTIFEQPYIGSLFKSENDVTWTAEQFEDIKFKMKIAEFDISAAAEIDLKVLPSYIAVRGDQFTTTSGSNAITVSFNNKHGLTASSGIQIIAQENGVFNGISEANISGFRTPLTIVDEYTIQYTASSNATSTGPILTGGQVVKVEMGSGGSGYTIAPAVSFSGGGSPTIAATATARISGGKVVAVDITNPGADYTSNPTVVFTNTGTGGTGAAANAYIDAVFTVRGNKPVNFVIPSIRTKKVNETDITAELTPTLLNYPGGALTTYNIDTPIDLNLTNRTYLRKNSLVALLENETANMAGGDSMKIRYRLSSTDKYVSPLLDLSNPTVMVYSNKINDQDNEDITSPSNSELSASGGNAEARYITKRFSLSTPSTGINLFSLLYSEVGCSVDWYIRMSNSASGVDHETIDWTLLECDIERNRSSRPNQYLDYTFYLYDQPEFDSYDLKCVMRSNDPAKTPIVKNFRAIIVA